MVNQYENNVFIFWVGDDYKVIKFLRALIYHHSDGGKNYKVHLLNYENLNNYVDKIPDYFWKLSLPHQADWIRVEVICKWGGLWLDSDTIVLSDLSDVFNTIKSNEGILVKDTAYKRNSLINGVFGSKPQTRLMLEWRSRINSILENKTNIKWNEIGGDILLKISYQYSNYLQNYVILDGQKTVYPIDWKMIYVEFIKKPYENWQKLERDYQPFLIITSGVYKKAEELSEEDIMKTPLSYFIRKSYQR